MTLEELIIMAGEAARKIGFDFAQCERILQHCEDVERSIATINRPHTWTTGGSTSDDIPKISEFEVVQ